MHLLQSMNSIEKLDYLKKGAMVNPTFECPSINWMLNRHTNYTMIEET
jgi:hypothetical protein